jgi:toxin ParE1/3/4
MSYRLSPRAEADLASISDHIAADNPGAAVRFLEAVEQACARLGETTLTGRARPEIAPDARSWVVGRYLLLYRVGADGIVLVRVVHGARDLGRVSF